MSYRIEDRWEIRELCARYALAIDVRDFDALGNLFCEDAVYARTAELEPMAVDRPGLLRYVRAHFAANPQVSFHTILDVVVDFDPADPDRARGVASGHAVSAAAGTNTSLAVRYHDSYARVAGRWLFSARWLHFPLRDGTAPELPVPG